MHLTIWGVVVVLSNWDVVGGWVEDMVESLRGIFDVLLGSLDIAIKLWGEVVESILSNVVPVLLGILSSELELVFQSLFGILDAGKSAGNIWVSSEMWHEIVHWVTFWGLWKGLVARSGTANWVVLEGDQVIIELSVDVILPEAVVGSGTCNKDGVFHYNIIR